MVNIQFFSMFHMLGKTYFSVKTSYLPTFPDDKAVILAVCLSFDEKEKFSFILQKVKD